jgi:hypothetical protein
MNSSNDSLQVDLVELGSRIDWPDGPDLAPGVLAQISRPIRSTHRWLAAALAALAIVFLLLTPPGKEAVAWLFRVAGIRIEFSQVTAPSESPVTLTIGDEVTLAAAQESVDFRVLAPGSLPPPNSVQLASWGGGRQVVMAWGASDQLPEVFETRTGLLLFQFRASVNEELLTKQATEATAVEEVTVRGSTGYFLSGAPHIVLFEGSDNMMIEDFVRLAANVLIWEADGVTYRIESSLGLEETLAVAESLTEAG